MLYITTYVIQPCSYIYIDRIKQIRCLNVILIKTTSIKISFKRFYR